MGIVAISGVVLVGGRGVYIGLHLAGGDACAPGHSSIKGIYKQETT